MPARMSRMSPPPRSLVVGVQELLAIAGRSAEVRLKDGVACVGKAVGGEAEALGSAAVRPAVRKDNQRIGRLGDLLRRQREQALQLPLVVLPAGHALFGLESLLEDLVRRG